MKEVVASGRTVDEAKNQALRELGVRSEEDVEVEVIDEGSKGVFGWGTKFARVKVKLLKEQPAEKAAPKAEKAAPAKKETSKRETGKRERAEMPPITVGERPLPQPLPKREEKREAPKREAKESKKEEALDKSQMEELEKEEAFLDEETIAYGEEIILPEGEEEVELLEEEEAGPYNPREILRQILEMLEVQGEIRLRRTVGGPVYSIEGEDLGILIGKHGQTLESLQFIVNLILLRRSEKKKKITIDIEGYRSRREKSLQDLAKRLADKARREKRNIVLEPMLPSERRIIHLTLQNNNYVSTFSQGEEPMRKVVISPKRRRYASAARTSGGTDNGNSAPAEE